MFFWVQRIIMSNMNTEKLQPHIKCKPGDVAETVLLVGDPDRIALVTKYWDEAKNVANNRGLPVWTGKYKGHPISIASTGMGAPSAAIVIEELINIGAKKFIRIGTCGALKKEINPGDLIIPTAALRAEGTTKEYEENDDLTFADQELAALLQSSAKEKEFVYWTGVNRTHDAFYEPVENMIKCGKMFEKRYAKESGLSLVSSEMECSAVFFLAALRGVRAATVLCVNTTEPLEEIEKNPSLVYELIENPNAKEGIDKAIRTALDAAVKE